MEKKDDVDFLIDRIIQLFDDPTCYKETKTEKEVRLKENKGEICVIKPDETLYSLGEKYNRELLHRVIGRFDPVRYIAYADLGSWIYYFITKNSDSGLEMDNFDARKALDIWP